MNENPGTPPPAPAPPTGFFASVRRIGIWRTDDRWIGGVSAGIAHRMRIDPVIVRGLFVVTGIFGGVGLLLYGLAWALLPESSDGRIHLESAVRGHFDVALVGAGGFFIVGASNPIFWWDASFGWGLSWLLVVGVVAGIVVLVQSQRQSPPVTPTFPLYPSATETTMPFTGETGPAGTAVHPASPGGADVTTRLDDDAAAGSTTVGHDGPGLAETTRLDGAAPTEPAPGGYDVGGPDPLTGATGPSDHGHPTGGDGGGYGGGPGGWNGAGGPPYPGTPAPADPPKPVRVVPGPGSRITSAVLAVSLLTAAGLALADHAELLDGNVWLLVGGAVLTILGLGVVLSGALGRRQGGLGGLAFVVAIVVVPAAMIAATVPGLTRLGQDGWRTFGNQEFTPTTVAAADAGRSLGAGQLVIDLSELDLDEDVTIPVEVGFGNASIIVPDGVGVMVDAKIGAGEVAGALDDDWTVRFADAGLGADRGTNDTISSGVGIDVQVSRPGSPQITVTTEVGFGQITIEEQR